MILTYKYRVKDEAPLERLGAWRSLSGAPLDAKNLTRLIYMDETGTHKRAPLLLVGAVILHADNELGKVEASLQGLIERYVDEPNRNSFIFHATDLFRGNLPELPRELHEQPARWKLLEEALEIAPKLKIPLCFGATMKERFRERNDLSAKKESDILIAMHAAAIAECTYTCEMWMRGFAESEVAMLFAENNNEVRKAAKATQILMRDKIKSRELLFLKPHNLPLVKIKDGINFVTKQESLALQLADVCTWACTKHMGNNDEKRFSEIIQPQISMFAGTSSDVARRL